MLRYIVVEAVTKFDFDLFVIGAGSGGVRAARVAAAHGAKVGIAEESRVGGTCVIRGCVPKKLLVYASRFSDDFQDATGFGWTLGERTFDWASLISAKDREVGRLETIYRKNLVNSGVSIFETRATLDGPNVVQLASTGEKLTSRKVLIATGARPAIATTTLGHELAITSDEVLNLPRLPKRITICGGGYIALEFACIFSGLGAEVDVVFRGNKILRGFDEDLRNALQQELIGRGICIYHSAAISRIEQAGDSLAVALSNGERLFADQVMYAIGRRPNVAGLGLESAGVEMGDNGGIWVNCDFQTSSADIYAVGDVTNKVNLTPVAIREGQAFADRVFGSTAASFNYEMIPTAVFTTPELGSVGLPEDVAADRSAVISVSAALSGLGGALDIYKTQFRPMKATLSGRSERTLMKLIVDRNSNRVMGCHVLGPDAGEIVQMAAIALRMGATKADFDATVALHPTAAEELVTMRSKSERN